MRISSPGNYTVLSEAALRVEIELEAFDLSRDGSWCLIANGQIALCAQREGVDMVLHVKPDPAAPRVLALSAELRSNVYANVLRRSQTVYVFVPAAADLRPFIEPRGTAERAVIVHIVTL